MAKNCFGRLSGAGGRHRQRQRGEEKGDGLQLKAHAAGAPQHREIQPHGRRQTQEGKGHLHRDLRPRCGDQLQTGQHLEQRQPQKGRPDSGGTLRPALFVQLLPLRHRLGKEHEGHAPQGDGIPQLYRGSSFHGFSIHSGAAFGAQVVNSPLLILAPAQCGVLAGDAGIVQPHIRRGAAADNIFPVGQQNRRAVGQAQLAPDLRRVGNAHQRPDGPVQDKKGQYRK